MFEAFSQLLAVAASPVDAGSDTERTVTETADAFDVAQLLDGVGAPLFALDAEGRVAVWNSAIEELTGVSSEEALGTEHVSEAFYPDGRRAQTLADKVLSHPDDADREFGLDRMTADSRLYVDQSVMTDRHGTERYIEFNAMPLYDGEELAGVVEVVHDRTEAFRQREQVRALDELGATIRRVADGRLDARVSFDDEHDALSGGVSDVLGAFNTMVARFERLTADVDDTTGTLGDAIEAASDAATDIESQVHEQTELLSRGTDEMQDLSASMEEIAATSDEVAAAAEQARTAAAAGEDAGGRVREATDAVVDISDGLLESVIALQEQMDDVEAVVEVIADVADQTNLLALNANIEAARAGDTGEGFAVVADEVKNLANQTHDHTEEVASRIERLQAQADETVAASEATHEQVTAASEEIDGVLESIGEISEAADVAASGVAEVSYATDEQATNIEEVTTTMQTLREHADETEAATGRIIDTTRHQSVAVDDLREQVGQLRGSGTADADGDVEYTSADRGGETATRSAHPDGGLNPAFD